MTGCGKDLEKRLLFYSTNLHSVSPYPLSTVVKTCSVCNRLYFCAGPCIHCSASAEVLPSQSRTSLPNCPANTESK